jgi:hypothetical protein
MPRRKSTGTKKTAGQKADFVSNKLHLLTNFAALWRQAIDCGTQTEFYNKITTLAVSRWGYHQDYSVVTDDADKEDDIPSKFSLVEADNNNNNNESNNLSAEEAERRQDIYKKLRTVSDILNCHLTSALMDSSETFPMVSSELQARTNNKRFHPKHLGKFYGSTLPFQRVETSL